MVKLKCMVARLVCSLVTILPLAGCYKTNCVPVPEGESGPELTMRFVINTGGRLPDAPAVRSVVTGEEEALLDENFIISDDMRFLLCTDGGVFLQELKPSVSSSEGYAVYTAETTFREPYFDVSGSGGGKVGFGLLVAANWTSVGTGYDALYGFGSRHGVQESGMAYSIPSVSPYPSAAERRGIPMYGYAHFSETVADLRSGNFTGEVPLLRSLAKIEVSDKIANREADGYPKVVSVTLRAYEGKAAFAPLSFVSGKQVTDPTAPSVHEEGGVRPFARVDGDVPMWRTYCPEMTLSDKGAFMDVVVANSPGTSLWKDEVTYSVCLDKYADFEHELLRNHVYRVDITGVGGAFSIDCTVCPWEGMYSVDIPDFE